MNSNNSAPLSSSPHMVGKPSKGRRPPYNPGASAPTESFKSPSGGKQPFTSDNFGGGATSASSAPRAATEDHGRQDNLKKRTSHQRNSYTPRGSHKQSHDSVSPRRPATQESQRYTSAVGQGNPSNTKQYSAIWTAPRKDVFHPAPPQMVSDLQFEASVTALRRVINYNQSKGRRIGGGMLPPSDAKQQTAPPTDEEPSSSAQEDPDIETKPRAESDGDGRSQPQQQDPVEDKESLLKLALTDLEALEKRVSAQASRNSPQRARSSQSSRQKKHRGVSPQSKRQTLDTIDREEPKHVGDDESLDPFPPPTDDEERQREEDANLRQLRQEANEETIVEKEKEGKKPASTKSVKHRPAPPQQTSSRRGGYGGASQRPKPGKEKSSLVEHDTRPISSNNSRHQDEEEDSRQLLHLGGLMTDPEGVAAVTLLLKSAKEVDVDLGPQSQWSEDIPLAAPAIVRATTRNLTVGKVHGTLPERVGKSLDYSGKVKSRVPRTHLSDRRREEEREKKIAEMIEIIKQEEQEEKKDLYEKWRKRLAVAAAETRHCNRLVIQEAEEWDNLLDQAEISVAQAKAAEADREGKKRAAIAEMTTKEAQKREQRWEKQEQEREVLKKQETREKFALLARQRQMTKLKMADQSKLWQVQGVERKKISQEHKDGFLAMEHEFKDKKKAIRKREEQLREEEYRRERAATELRRKRAEFERKQNLEREFHQQLETDSRHRIDQEYQRAYDILIRANFDSSTSAKIRQQQRLAAEKRQREFDAANMVVPRLGLKWEPTVTSSSMDRYAVAAAQAGTPVGLAGLAISYPLSCHGTPMVINGAPYCELKLEGVDKQLSEEEKTKKRTIMSGRVTLSIRSLNYKLNPALERVVIACPKADEDHEEVAETSAATPCPWTFSPYTPYVTDSPLRLSNDGSMLLYDGRPVAKVVKPAAVVACEDAVSLAEQQARDARKPSVRSASQRRDRSRSGSVTSNPQGTPAEKTLTIDLRSAGTPANGPLSSGGGGSSELIDVLYLDFEPHTSEAVLKSIVSKLAFQSNRLSGHEADCEGNFHLVCNIRMRFFANALPGREELTSEVVKTSTVAIRTVHPLLAAPKREVELYLEDNEPIQLFPEFSMTFPNPAYFQNLSKVNLTSVASAAGGGAGGNDSMSGSAVVSPAPDPNLLENEEGSPVSFGDSIPNEGSTTGAPSSPSSPRHRAEENSSVLTPLGPFTRWTEMSTSAAIAAQDAGGRVQGYQILISIGSFDSGDRILLAKNSEVVLEDWRVLKPGEPPERELSLFGRIVGFVSGPLYNFKEIPVPGADQADDHHLGLGRATPQPLPFLAGGGRRESTSTTLSMEHKRRRDSLDQSAKIAEQPPTNLLIKITLVQDSTASLSMLLKLLTSLLYTSVTQNPNEGERYVDLMLSPIRLTTSPISTRNLVDPRCLMSKLWSGGIVRDRVDGDSSLGTSPAITPSSPNRQPILPQLNPGTASPISAPSPIGGALAEKLTVVQNTISVGTCLIDRPSSIRRVIKVVPVDDITIIDLHTNKKQPAIYRAPVDTPANLMEFLPPEAHLRVCQHTTVDDPDSTHFSGGSVEVEIIEGARTGDYLYIGGNPELHLDIENSSFPLFPGRGTGGGFSPQTPGASALRTPITPGMSTGSGTTSLLPEPSSGDVPVASQSSAFASTPLLAQREPTFILFKGQRVAKLVSGCAFSQPPPMMKEKYRKRKSDIGVTTPATISPSSPGLVLSQNADQGGSPASAEASKKKRRRSSSVKPPSADMSNSALLLPDNELLAKPAEPTPRLTGEAANQPFGLQCRFPFLKLELLENYPIEALEAIYRSISFKPAGSGISSAHRFGTRVVETRAIVGDPYEEKFRKYDPFEPIRSTASVLVCEPLFVPQNYTYTYKEGSGAMNLGHFNVCDEHRAGYPSWNRGFLSVDIRDGGNEDDRLYMRNLDPNISEMGIGTIETTNALPIPPNCINLPRLKPEGDNLASSRKDGSGCRTFELFNNERTFLGTNTVNSREYQIMLRDHERKRRPVKEGEGSSGTNASKKSKKGKKGNAGDSGPESGADQYQESHSKKQKKQALVPLKRKDIQAFLRLLTYENRSPNPTVLRKVLILSLNDGNEYSTTHVALEVNILTVDDATEIFRANPGIINYRHGFDGCSLPLYNDIWLEDPDTDVYNGGYISVTMVSGMLDGDKMDFLTPVEQRDLRAVTGPNAGNDSLAKYRPKRREYEMAVDEIGRELSLPQVCFYFDKKSGKCFMGPASLLEKNPELIGEVDGTNDDDDDDDPLVPQNESTPASTAPPIAHESTTSFSASNSQRGAPVDQAVVEANTTVEPPGEEEDRHPAAPEGMFLIGSFTLNQTKGKTGELSCNLMVKLLPKVKASEDLEESQFMPAHLLPPIVNQSYDIQGSVNDGGQPTPHEAEHLELDATQPYDPPDVTLDMTAQLIRCFTYRPDLKPVKVRTGSKTFVLRLAPEGEAEEGKARIVAQVSPTLLMLSDKKDGSPPNTITFRRKLNTISPFKQLSVLADTLFKAGFVSVEVTHGFRGKDDVLNFKDIGTTRPFHLKNERQLFTSKELYCGTLTQITDDLGATKGFLLNFDSLSRVSGSMIQALFRSLTFANLAPPHESSRIITMTLCDGSMFQTSKLEIPVAIELDEECCELSVSPHPVVYILPEKETVVENTVESAIEERELALNASGSPKKGKAAGASSPKSARTGNSTTTTDSNENSKNLQSPGQADSAGLELPSSAVASNSSSQRRPESGGKPPRPPQLNASQMAEVSLLDNPLSTTTTTKKQATTKSSAPPKVIASAPPSTLQEALERSAALLPDCTLGGVDNVHGVIASPGNIEVEGSEADLFFLRHDSVSITMDGEVMVEGDYCGFLHGSSYYHKAMKNKAVTEEDLPSVREDEAELSRMGRHHPRLGRPTFKLYLDDCSYPHLLILFRAIRLARDDLVPGRRQVKLQVTGSNGKVLYKNSINVDVTEPLLFMPTRVSNVTPNGEIFPNAVVRLPPRAMKISWIPWVPVPPTPADGDFDFGATVDVEDSKDTGSRPGSGKQKNNNRPSSSTSSLGAKPVKPSSSRQTSANRRPGSGSDSPTTQGLKRQGSLLNSKPSFTQDSPSAVAEPNKRILRLLVNSRAGVQKKEDWYVCEKEKFASIVVNGMDGKGFMQVEFNKKATASNVQKLIRSVATAPNSNMEPHTFELTLESTVDAMTVGTYHAVSAAGFGALSSPLVGKGTKADTVAGANAESEQQKPPRGGKRQAK